MHPFLPITHIFINIHMKIHVCVCVCVLLVAIHSFPTSWFLLREEGEVLKSHKENKRSCHFYFTQKKSGSAQNLKREPALQKLELYYYRDKVLCP